MLARAAGLLLVAALPAQELTLSAEQMTADLQQLVRTVSRRWAYAEDRAANAGVDLSALAAAATRRLADVRRDADFVAIVREFVAGLQDGHAFVNWDGTEPRPFRRWPFTVVDTHDGLVVDELLETWNDTAVRARRGDVLLAVDGVPVHDRIAAAMRTTNASTPGARRRWALASAVFNDTDPSRYRLRRPDGTEVEIEAHASKHLPRTAPRPPIETRALADGVHYVAVRTFAHADAAAWSTATPAGRQELIADERRAIQRALAPAATAKCLVLDLRGNGGGTDLLAMEVAGHLVPQDSTFYRLASRSWLGGWNTPSSHRLQCSADAAPLPCKLVVLIDAGTFSAADNLCRCLHDLHPDVTFVGEATGGGTGAPRALVTLEHSQVVVGACTMRVFGPKGELIEGRGTVPDVAVVPTREAWLAGRDEALEAALTVAR